MNLHVIDTGYFKLDGGAMFGVVPKSIWNKLNPADGNNMCTWAMRCLLVEDGDKLILIDTGIGNKQDENFFRHFFLHGEDSLEKSIIQAGFHPDDITDVLLTHLHFDHVGGATVYTEGPGSAIVPTFKNATYWVHKDHWSWALDPNAREKASFLRENIVPISESGQLNLIDTAFNPFRNIELIPVDGHTEKQMLPKIHYRDKVVLFAADLIPSSAHIPIPYVMSYDVRPLLSLKEKEILLKEAQKNNYFVFFEHDPLIECCTLTTTEKGIRMKDSMLLKDIL